MVSPHRHVWFKPFARTGYAARGLVYIVIGFFAVLAAIGSGEQQGSRDALRTILDTPFGDVTAILLMCGMVSYLIWRFIQAIFDTDKHGLGFKGAAIRGGLIASGVTYGILTVFTFGLWNGSQGDDGDGGGGSQIVDFIVSIVGSQAVAYALTAVFIGVGIAHIAKAVRKGYARHFEAPQRVMDFVHPIARTGLTARGLSFLVVAFLLFYRGLNAGGEGSPTPGVEDALSFVQGLPFGGILLGAMGVGLTAFAVYSILEAVWRRINVEDADAIGR
jgi:hypothetical protein